jgi:hypothetical protein
MERRAKMELFERVGKGIRVRRGDSARGRAQAGRASAEGAPGAGQRRSAGAPARGHERPVSGRLMPFIVGLLEAARSAPHKQHHPAQRIWQRIMTALPERKVSAVIRQKVRERKTGVGLVSAHNL